WTRGSCRPLRACWTCRPCRPLRAGRARITLEPLDSLRSLRSFRSRGPRCSGFAFLPDVCDAAQGCQDHDLCAVEMQRITRLKLKVFCDEPPCRACGGKKVEVDVIVR